MKTIASSTKNNYSLKKISPSLRDVCIFLIVILISYSYKAFSYNVSSGPPMVRIKLSGMPNYLDETVIYYQAGATDGFDPQYDSYKFPGATPAPYIAQQHGTTFLDINGISPVAPTFSIHLKVTTPITGSYTIFTTDFSDLPVGTCVKLTDLFTNTTVDILANPYVCILSNTTTAARFIITINHLRLPVISNIIQPSCSGANSGKLKMNGNNFGPWNYLWKDSTGTILQTSIAIMASDSLVNLTGGLYNVVITSVSNQCYSYDTTVYLNQIITPIVAFTAPDTIMASFTPNFSPSNQSSNCVTYKWDFGNGDFNSTLQPSYSYTLPGLYTVKLKSISATGCADSSAKSLRVLGLATGIKNELKKYIKFYNTGGNMYVIEMPENLVKEITINLYDTEGKELLKKHLENIMPNDKIVLDLNNLPTDVYFITLSSKNILISTHKIVAK